MNLITQATQPSAQEYRTCPVCGTVFRLRNKYRKQIFCTQRCSTTKIPNNPEPSPDEVAEGVRRIELTKGKYAIVDADKYEDLNQWAWHAAWCSHRKSFIVIRNSDPDEAGRRKTVYMSRVVMDAQAGTMVDHRDHDTLRNTRKNLRFATDHENTRNARKHCITSSRFKGVCRQKPWVAYIMVNNRHKYLGEFDTEMEAGEAYRVAALKYYGDFACPSEISDPYLSVVP